MIALDRRTHAYPVVMPDRRLRGPPPPRLYGSQRTEAAAPGYSTLRPHRELAGLESEYARLQATVSALRSPQRIERIATSELGMAPPRQRQLAAITTAPAGAASPPPPLPP